MKLRFWFEWQVGIMITFGVNYEKRKYITFDLPFVNIQILWFIPKKLNKASVKNRTFIQNEVEEKQCRKTKKFPDCPKVPNESHCNQFVCWF